MNAELIDAIAKANELRVGAEAAQTAINEAVIATLLQNFPPLAGPLASNLEAAAAHNRPDSTEGALTGTAFDHHIAQMGQLIAAFQR